MRIGFFVMTADTIVQYMPMKQKLLMHFSMEF